MAVNSAQSCQNTGNHLSYGYDHFTSTNYIWQSIMQNLARDQQGRFLKTKKLECTGWLMPDSWLARVGWSDG